MPLYALWETQGRTDISTEASEDDCHRGKKNLLSDLIFEGK